MSDVPPWSPTTTELFFIVGDARLTDSAYPFVRNTLDRLLDRRLPRVDVGFSIQDTFDRLTEFNGSRTGDTDLGTHH